VEVSENRWEILEIGMSYIFNDETGVYAPAKPKVKYLLRRKGEKQK